LQNQPVRMRVCARSRAVDQTYESHH
jgi:hypothetical protein